ncbi:MAG: NAD(+) synthase [Anaerolineaceae bacterium]|jgi:NAD+ synthase (glutamine-hydrolysing)
MSQKDSMQDFKINLCVPEVRVADPTFNASSILAMIDQICINSTAPQLILFPQLCLSAYTCDELFTLTLLRESCLRQLGRIEGSIRGREAVIGLGLPLEIDGNLYDALALLNGKGLFAFVINQKPDLRYFKSASDIREEYLTLHGKEISIIKDGIIPDLIMGKKVKVWIGKLEEAPKIEENELLLNPCALPAFGDVDHEALFWQYSQNQKGILAICSAGVSESTSQFAFSGLAQVWQEGRLLASGKQLSFQNETTSLSLPCDTTDSKATLYKQSKQKKELPFLFENDEDQLERIFAIQVAGLVGRLRHTGSKRMVIGLSGGADSSMALMACCQAAKNLNLSPNSILGVVMPGPGTSTASLERVWELIEVSGVQGRNNDISQTVQQHLAAIGHDARPDLTFENVQARIRTLYLMNYANLHQGLVIGTGDLSEIALGWSTYNGDQMSMYNVNAGLPKSVLLRLLPWAAERLFGEAGLKIAENIAAAPISPELKPVNEQGQTEQITEEVVGPYRLHDFFLWHFLAEKKDPKEIFNRALETFGKEFPAEFILNCLRIFFERFFRHQFKRSASPDGVQVFTVGLDPRNAWRMPSDARAELWLSACHQLTENLSKMNTK